MTNLASRYDPQDVEWRHVHSEDTTGPRVYLEYSLLGFNLPNHRLNTSLGFGKLGHPRRHRHIASTVAPVLEREQHPVGIQPDGVIKSIV